MPFELTNALTVFMNLMSQVLRLYLDQFVLVFIYGILVYSKTKEKHATHLRIVLQTLRDHQLYAKKEKCDFWMSKAILGHMVSHEWISMAPTKIEAILQC